ncbi:DUF6544 family protein [Thioalkalicoccus limnaeus]
MVLLTIAGWLLLIGAVAGIATGLWRSARDARRAQVVWDALLAERETAPETYDPAMVADLPEIARRYFATAIAPGTPLHRVVELEMAGALILNGRELPMQADQVLAPPHGFVWRARAGSGWVRFSGSDGYRGGRTSWTRFWLWEILPVARCADSEDHARAAAARLVMETVWVPAALLPQHGALWTQTGPDRAEIRFPRVPGVEPIHLVLDASGRVLEMSTQRWSDVNRDRTYRLQPFGGRMLAHATHQGFSIPVAMEVGHHYGTPEYAPFFRAHLTRVT